MAAEVVALVMGGKLVGEVAEALTVEAVVAVRIRTNLTRKEWAVIVIETHIVDGSPTETQEEKGNLRGCVVIAITKVVIIRENHLTPQVAEVVLGGVEVISHTKQAVATADED